MTDDEVRSCFSATLSGVSAILLVYVARHSNIIVCIKSRVY